MKKQKRNLIKAGLLFLSVILGVLLSQYSCAQSVQAMVKNQPFPYPTGVAMDTLLYKNVKTKLLAADSLRAASERAIKTLQTEILATRKAMDDQFRLGQYDAAKAQTLLVQMNILQRELVDAQALLREAQLARDKILRELPRKIRKVLESATPDQIAQATVEYIHTLQKRKWTWSGISAGAGFLLGVIAAF